MSSPSAVIERIAALLAEGEIPPTPSNYEFWYRYATGADPELVEAVDAVRRAVGRVTVRAMGNIRRELYGGSGQGTFSRLIEDTERQLDRMAAMSSAPRTTRATIAASSTRAASRSSTRARWTGSARCSPRWSSRPRR